MGTRRQLAIRKAIRAEIPRVPFADAADIFEHALTGAKLRGLPPSVAVWLAIVSHVRHAHTDYDALLDEGYDRESARHLVAARMDEVLIDWGSSRSVEAEVPGYEEGGGG
jgi:hypothetical protein